MSLTLGEKLRQARESRGITISEVAEQTRISALYLEAIENNDYRTLPGGIFNKGFVKSYSKYVGIDEQEALRDYAQLISDQGETSVDETRTYRPEVLTDDRSSSSMLPTLLFAVIILALFSFAIWWLVNYIRDTQNQPVTASNSAVSNKASNTASNTSGNSNSAPSAPTTMPASSEIKVELKALAEKMSVEVTIDGKKATSEVLPETPVAFTAQQSVKLRYYRGFTSEKVQLSINGKVITAPAGPASPKLNGIEFEITKENVQQIWQSGAIVLGQPPTANANAGNANPANTATNTTR